MFFISAWLEENDMDKEFEAKEAEDLGQLLKRFYAEARDKDGNTYSPNSMKSIIASINRHLQQPPLNRSIDITKDREFKSANFVFQVYLKVNKLDGKDVTKHKDPISDADWLKLQNSDELSVDPQRPCHSANLYNITFSNSPD